MAKIAINFQIDLYFQNLNRFNKSILKNCVCYPFESNDKVKIHKDIHNHIKYKTKMSILQKPKMILLQI